MLEKAHILRCTEYDSSKDAHQYHRSHCYLFLPWHGHEDSPLEGGTKSWSQVYSDNRQIIMHNMTERRCRLL